jgi:hypothetical protein
MSEYYCKHGQPQGAPCDERAAKQEGVSSLAAPTSPALQFKIGDRLYWISRSRDGSAWKIVANGDLVEQASILHYGDVAAFVKMATRLEEIENRWAARK